MAGDENSWRTSALRKNMITKIEEAIQISGATTMKNSNDMESHVFMKATSREEYLGFVARLIIHIREMGAKKNNNGNAPSGSQGIQDPIGALQTLAQQGTGNNRVINMPGQGGNPQNIMSQAPQNTATNLLQSLNQRPNQTMPMQGMPNKMGGMGMMPGQVGGPMSHMNQMQGIQNNTMMSQMNQMGQPNLAQQMSQISQNQMVQMSTGQMQQNMSQLQLQNQLTSQMGNSMSGTMPQQLAPMGPNQLSQQLSHMQRKPEMMNSPYSGPRNVTPNQFLGQSPSQSVPSPGGLSAQSSAQMATSPAMVLSPSSQHIMLTSQRTLGVAVSSPSSSLNTPAGMGAIPSPSQEDQVYIEKLRQLGKHIEPLRQIIAKMSIEGNLEKLSKMNMLLEIVSNPGKRFPMETLIKCEAVLKNFTKRGDNSVGPPATTIKENFIFSPLLDAVTANLQSPVANHTLHRTFGPCSKSLLGPEIKNLPPPLKKRKLEESPSEIPDVLQGEIARLDQRFKVSLDSAQQTGSKDIQLICWLDDRHLPCVPPVSVTVPADYPSTPPRCFLVSHEYATPFLSAVRKALNSRIAKMPKRYSVSQLLDTWEMSVRQACSPFKTEVTIDTILMGL